MPTPEPTPAASEQPPASTQLTPRQAQDVAIYGKAAPTRTARATGWIGWHVGELAGVVIPLVLAPTVWPGFYAASGLAAALWALHEVRDRREVRAKARNSKEERDELA